MSKKPDGGPAFPTRALGQVRVPDGSASKNLHFSLIGGMSLRDYFAGQAAVGAFGLGDTDIDDAIMARRCYELADAMLQARES